MKFAIFLQHYFPYGGLQRDALRLALAARDAGDQVTLVVSTWDGPQPENLDILTTNSSGHANHIKAKRFEADCQRLMAQGEFDTAICFSRVAKTPFYFCGDPCFLDRFLKKKPSLARFLPRYSYLIDCERSIFGKTSTTHIFFLAKSEIPAYQKHYPLRNEQWTLIPPWLNPPKSFDSTQATLKEKITNTLHIPKNSTLLLFVGSDFHRKGLDHAIGALAQLNSQNIHLLVCGQDSPTHYQNQAEKLGIAKQVHLLGPRDDIPELMYSADLLIHPARQETAGMVLIEALTYGLPVLCTEHCGYSSHVSDAGCPLLVNQPTPESLALAVSKQLEMESPQEQRQSILDWALEPARYRTAELILNQLRQSTPLQTI